MKKIIAALLSTCLVLAGCSSSPQEQTSPAQDSPWSNQPTPTFTSLSDPGLADYLEAEIYEDLIEDLNSDGFFIENVETVYVSKEYLAELKYNSQENIYFGYKLSDIIESFGETPYVFTVGDDGKTHVVPFSPYDDTWDVVLQNVAAGTGVILVCVTVSAVTGGAGLPVASAIFAVFAESAGAMAASGAVISGAISGIVTGIETGDPEETMKSVALGASDGFKIGAIMGAAAGGVGEAVALRGAATNGLSYAEAAAIQQESKYPVDVIKGFETTEQYKICKEAGLQVGNVSNKTALVRKIDLEFTKDGLTNAERMAKGQAALDSTGTAYELHHIGQKVDSTLAVLTRAEHRQGGNHRIWHYVGDAVGENPAAQPGWSKQASDFWKELGEQLSKAA